MHNTKEADSKGRFLALYKLHLIPQKKRRIYKLTLEADHARKPKRGPSSYMLCLAVIYPPSGAQTDVPPISWTD